MLLERHVQVGAYLMMPCEMTNLQVGAVSRTFDQKQMGQIRLQLVDSQTDAL
jgi:hypothetical protein